MARFRLPPISPLIGANPKTYYKVLRGRVVDSSYRTRLLFTTLIQAVATLFMWLDITMTGRKAAHVKCEEAPLFIIGHWRSGTTHLQNLMNCDPQFGRVTLLQAAMLIRAISFRAGGGPG